ncbi:MAG: hypothetical protein J6A25_09335 [Lachnospiraceae bacterium]|nr:hypothetical protein [Lachnospiraceae bacterium]
MTHILIFIIGVSSILNGITINQLVKKVKYLEMKQIRTSDLVHNLKEEQLRGNK